MNKYLKILIVAIICGGIIAYFFYKDINDEVKALTTKEDTIYLFQTGVFKDSNNANNFASTFDTSIIYEDGIYHRVIVAIASKTETRKYLEEYLSKKEINYYVKEMRVNKDFLGKIKTYEDILVKSNKDEVINNINNSILKLFLKYI